MSQLFLKFFFPQNTLNTKHTKLQSGNPVLIKHLQNFSFPSFAEKPCPPLNLSLLIVYKQEAPQNLDCVPIPKKDNVLASDTIDTVPQVLNHTVQDERQFLNIDQTLCTT